MEQLEANKEVLGDELAEFCFQICKKFDQGHIFSFWSEPGLNDEKKISLALQLEALDRHYPEGLGKYISNARILLENSRNGVNAFENFAPHVPTGEKISLEPFSEDNLANFMEKEAAGMKQVNGACFVIVAGGLGERLGYSGIKLELPTDVITETPFLELYIESILALQARFEGIKLPLAIMTSGDTHDQTVELLEKNSYFGMEKEQITLIKQQKVAALIDNEAHIAIDEESYSVRTKPHGHGDVHSLLYTSGLARKWADEKRKYVIFLQDTNILVFRGLLSALGVSHNLNLAMNSMSVPRNDGEAVGSICKLVNEKTKDEITINVEYNQLDGLLAASKDFAKPKGNNKRSPFPGNINVLIMNLDVYSKALDISKGGVPEFVNPKYADEAKTKFKSPTRLECMMQDFPRLLANPDIIKHIGKENLNIGFTQLDRFICYSPAKNNLSDASKKFKQTGYAASMASCERDYYNFFARALEIIGVKIGKVGTLYPRIVLKPSFAVNLEELKSKFPTPELVEISGRSSLVIEGNVEIRCLQLDGHLELRARGGSGILVNKLCEKNAGTEQKLIEKGDVTPESIAIRGYKLVPSGSNLKKIESNDGEVVINQDSGLGCL